MEALTVEKCSWILSVDTFCYITFAISIISILIFVFVNPKTIMKLKAFEDVHEDFMKKIFGLFLILNFILILTGITSIYCDKKEIMVFASCVIWIEIISFGLCHFTNIFSVKVDKNSADTSNGTNIEGKSIIGKILAWILNMI